MDKKENHQQQEKQLIYTLAHYGAKAAKLSSKRQRKLEEYVLPSASDDLHLSGQGPMKIRDMREYIDRWENTDLNEKDNGHYYIDENSRGDSSLWEKYQLIVIIVGLILVLWIFFK